MLSTQHVHGLCLPLRLAHHLMATKVYMHGNLLWMLNLPVGTKFDPIGARFESVEFRTAIDTVSFIDVPLLVEKCLAIVHGMKPMVSQNPDDRYSAAQALENMFSSGTIAPPDSVADITQCSTANPTPMVVDEPSE